MAIMIWGKFMKPDTKVIAHQVQPYLFHTGSWIYNQIRFPEYGRHIVLTYSTENLDQFPFHDIYSKGSLPLPYRYLERIYRKIIGKGSPYWAHVCRKEKVGLLHSHFGGAGIQNVSLAQKLGIPHIVSFYGWDYTKAVFYDPGLGDKYCQMFDRIAGVFVEGSCAKSTIVDMGCPSEKVHVSHLGVDIGSIKSVRRTWDRKQAFKILLVGRFTQKKGIIIALRAIEQVASSLPDISIEISIVGDAGQRAEEQRIKSEIKEFVNSTILKGSTHFLGYIPYQDVLSLSYEQHLFMQTSIHADDGDCEGGFPVIITDMKATGMPILGSAHCDIPEIVKDGKNGRTANEGDVEHTASVLEDIIEQYDTYSGAWFDYDVSFLCDEFDARACAARRSDIYRQIIASWSGLV